MQADVFVSSQVELQPPVTGCCHHYLSPPERLSGDPTLATCKGCFCSLPPCSLKPQGAPPVMEMQIKSPVPIFSFSRGASSVERQARLCAPLGAPVEEAARVVHAGRRYWISASEPERRKSSPASGHSPLLRHAPLLSPPFRERKELRTEKRPRLSNLAGVGSKSTLAQSG